MLDNESNREVDGFSRVWNSPLGTDIISIGCREPMVQDLVIKWVEFRFNGLVVVVQTVAFGYNVLWAVAAIKTED